MTLSVTAGGFYGDCGKSVKVAYETIQDRIDAAVGTQGPQHGGTVHYNGVVHKFRHLPASVFRPETELLMAVGSIIDKNVLLDEVHNKFKDYNVHERLRIDESATAILPRHIEAEAQLKKDIGSVGTGYSYALADRVTRQRGILVKDVPELKEYSEGVCVSDIVHDYLDEGKKVLIEGSQATFLSNFHGEYPFVNGYDNTIPALLSQVGVGHQRLDNGYLLFKSFVTRVGDGYLEGELSPEETVKRGWEERGTVTNRLRRAAPFNIKLAKKAIRLNTPTDVVITKIDKLYPENYQVREWDDLSHESRQWLDEIEQELKTPITMVKTGPDIFDMVDVRYEKGTI